MSYGPDTDIWGNPIDPEEEEELPQPAAPDLGPLDDYGIRHPGPPAPPGAYDPNRDFNVTGVAEAVAGAGPEPRFSGAPAPSLFASFLGQAGAPAAAPIPATDLTPGAEVGALLGGEVAGAPGEAAGGFGVPDIDYLRGDPFTGEFEQAAIARADELVSQRYNALRQQRAEEMARRGIGPDSPFWQSEMRKIESAAAQESSAFRRRLQIDRMGERRSRLAEARQVEWMIDAMERQRLSEMMAYLTGNQFQPSSKLADILGAQASQAGQGVGAAAGGLGELIAAYMQSQQVPWWQGGAS